MTKQPERWHAVIASQPWTLIKTNTQEEAEFKGREMLRRARDNNGDELVVVLISSDNNNPKQPATESDIVYELGRWTGSELLDGTLEPLDL